MSVREINNKIIRINEYALIKIFINEIITIKIIIIIIIIKVHFILNFKMNILININIIIFQKLCINFKRQKLMIKSCKNLKTVIQVMSRD